MTTLATQLQDAIAQCSGVFAEYPLPCGNTLTVEICAHSDGVLVTGEFAEDRFFSGNVANYPNGFYIAFDAENEPELDYYLQEISDEITEGYLIPNGLSHDDDGGEY